LAQIEQAKGKEFKGMTTYTSPFDSQPQTDIPSGTINGWQPPDQREDRQLPFPEQRENWQIVPPIITDGRMAAVKVQNATSQEGHGHVSSSQQEATTLFKVSFTGLDQQRYSVSATVKQPSNGVLVGQEQVEASAPMLKMPSTATLAQPLLHPAWQESVSPAESERMWDSELATPIGVYPSVTQVSTLGRPNVSNSEREIPSPNGQANKADADKSFLLQIIQPGLVGLMDGSVSTLAPIFAVAFATHRPFTTFLVGMAAALGAGISMAFSEALSDDGDLTGRGNPFVRGGVTGLMTFLSGAGHALPFLVPNLQLALFMAYAVVAIELLAIAAIRHKFFGTNWGLSIIQVVGGGALVFVAALLLGNA
jgi:hypothetical protein